MEERRRYKRYKRALDVKYSCAKGPLIVESTSKSEDISQGGISLLLDDNIKISDRVRLAITLPWRKHPLDAIGRVVWTSPRSITGNVAIERDCGLEFAWCPAIEEIMAHIKD